MNSIHKHPFFARPFRDVIADVAQASQYATYIPEQDLKDLLLLVMTYWEDPSLADRYYQRFKQIPLPAWMSKRAAETFSG